MLEYIVYVDWYWLIKYFLDLKEPLQITLSACQTVGSLSAYRSSGHMLESEKNKDLHTLEDKYDNRRRVQAGFSLLQPTY